MKNFKRMAVSMLLVLGLMLMALPVHAADERLGTVVDGSLLTDDTYAEGQTYLKQRGSILSYGSGSVSIAGTRRVTLFGATTAHKTVEQVQVTMYLQRLEGSNWEHVLTMGPKIKYNANYVSNSNTYSVAGGYYYRAYGAHTAINGSTSESATSYSNGVWVN